MWLVNVSIRRPVFAVMVIGGLTVLGWLSLGRLGIDLFPNVEFPYVAISGTLEGASPDTVETEITDIIESNVNTISGIKQLKSVSSDGISQVFIEFELEEKVDVKAQDVRDKVNVARKDLPRDIDPPIVEKVDPDAAPILSVMISGEASIRDITTFADEVVKEAIQRLPGVGSAKIVGGRKRAIRIWLDAGRMRAYGVTANDVVQAIRTEHADLPGGRLEVDGARREFGVKTKAEAKSADEFRKLVVAFRENSLPTRLEDVARIEDGTEDERTYAALNGRTGVSLEIRRQSGRNTVAVARLIRAEVEKLKKQAPPGMQIVIARDVSRFIESSISDVQHELVIAMGLVVLVTFFFLLSWRATLIVATAIPTSLIATFFVFYIFGFTINLLTLLALTVAIGLLVDDAIVVIESIQREVDEGKPREIAAAEGTTRVGLAVLAGTFATLAVFVPIAFMSGIVGRFFFQYGLAIVFSVTVSLLVALTLTPMLSSRFLTPASAMSRILKPIEHFHHGLDSAYGWLVKWAITLRYVVVLLALGSVVIGGYYARKVPTGFANAADRSEFLGSIDLPLGTGVGEAKAAAKSIQEHLAKIEHVRDVFVTAGANSQEKVNRLDLYVSITPKQQRKATQFVLMDQARTALKAAVSNATKISVAEVPWVSGGGVSQLDIEYVIRGSDLKAMQAYAERVMADMRQSGSFDDIQSSYEEGRPEVQIRVNRSRAGDLSVSAQSIATTARAVIGGLDVATFEDKGRRYDVRVRLEEDQRQSMDQLRLMQVRGANGRLIDLPSVADITFESGPSQIERQDRARKISIMAAAKTGVALGDASKQFIALMDRHPLPQGMTGSFEGKVKRMQESLAAIGAAFVLAMIALYMLLASQFNSFVQPLIVMLTGPLSFSGAFAALYYGNQELSLFAQIGLLALMGIVMKNGILLIDRANQLREEGVPTRQAMLEAAPERLRPVLMTAFAAVFGMIPVALAVSDGAEWRNGLGYLIIGGLTSSTILTLIVVPAVYVMVGNAGESLGKMSRWIKARMAQKPRERQAPAE
ncbi:MAG: efflux RND transporter permease subunit [Hyphomicrobium sp.]|nr:efflux RND transporter permease subunit [Hyphomicrobium sp.]